jgi:hypothetical protein
LHLPQPLLPGAEPHGLLPAPAAQLLQASLGADVPREANLLHEVGLRAVHEDGLLQGLPHGA